MSMYAVNASVPKTLVRYIVESVALKDEILHDVLMDICDTPVSPELLPPDKNGKIAQKTEEVLGSYDLHDFFLYQMLRHHDEPKKIYDLACVAFKEQLKRPSQHSIIVSLPNNLKETVCQMVLRSDLFVSHLEVIGECQATHQEIYGQNKWRKFSSPTFLG